MIYQKKYMLDYMFMGSASRKTIESFTGGNIWKKPIVNKQQPGHNKSTLQEQTYVSLL